METTNIAETLVHPILGGLALVASALILKNHGRNGGIWALFLVGNLLIMLPMLLSHVLMGQWIERTFTMTGSVFLILMHYFNLLRRKRYILTNRTGVTHTNSPLGLVYR